MYLPSTFNLNFHIYTCCFFDFILIKIFNLHSGYINENINSIKNWSRQLFPISFYAILRTNTGFLFISHKATGARIKSSDQHEFCRISVTCINSIDCYFSIFYWLAKGFDKLRIEFQEFVKK